MNPDITIIHAADWPPVVALFERCAAAENIVLPLALEGDITPILAAARIGDTLVGGAALYGYFEIEAVIAVDPAWRRRGIGRSMVAQIDQWARARNGSWLLLADEAGASVAPFAAALGLQRATVEARLSLDPARVPSAPLPPTGWQIRSAEPSDVTALASIIADAFGDSRDQVTAFVADRINHPVHRFVIGELGGVPVAALRLLREPAGVTITTFGVRRSHQGRGYGRLLLLMTLDRLLAAGYTTIQIEVEETNTAAYQLYRSCGFVLDRRYGHYLPGKGEGEWCRRRDSNP